VRVVAGVDLGGTAINYTLVTPQEQFLIEGLCEHPARSKEGPRSLPPTDRGRSENRRRKGGPEHVADVAVAGLDTPGPATAAGVLSAEGSTNFVHRDWCGFDIRGHLSARLGIPVTYLNDGNAGALWGHFNIFGTDRAPTSVTVVIGTGLGGGVIIDGRDVKGRKGFGGELGHVLLPYQNIRGIEGWSRSATADASAIWNRFAR
jgi:glucokinase